MVAPPARARASYSPRRGMVIAFCCEDVDQIGYQYVLILVNTLSCATYFTRQITSPKWDEREGERGGTRLGAKLTIFGEVPNIYIYSPLGRASFLSLLFIMRLLARDCGVYIYQKTFYPRLQMRRHLQRIPTNHPPADLLDLGRVTSGTPDHPARRCFLLHR